MVGLNEDLVAIAVDIHPRQASVALVDLNGRLLSRALAPLTSDPADSMRLIIDCMQRMYRTAPRKSIKGIGISLPGE
jgi:predicted NBD/HSP70 family sugar kinase